MRGVQTPFMMKTFSLPTFFLFAGATALAAPGAFTEIGLSHFALDGARFEKHPTPVAVWDETSKLAPFVAAGYSFTDGFGLKLSYHYVADISSAAKYNSFPTDGDVQLPVVTMAYYEDDLHVVGLSPEFKFKVGNAVTLAFAPVLNWVANQGRAIYSHGVINVAPDPSNPQVVVRRSRDDDGFTVGGSIALLFSLSERSALSFSYQYANLEPSYDREGHILTGAWRWTF